MTDGKERARKLTQFSRQPHWIAERANPPYSPFMRWVFRYVPLAMRLHRFWIFYLMESSLLEFGLHSTGLKLRQDLFTTRLEYLRKHAPEKYHDVLTPKIEIGCKRKVLDTDYLACLHRENMELVSSDPIKEITETGVRTESGRDINADAIVLATGFQTQKVLHPMEIKGEKGITLNEHVSILIKPISFSWLRSKQTVVLSLLSNAIFSGTILREEPHRYISEHVFPSFPTSLL